MSTISIVKVQYKDESRVRTTLCNAEHFSETDNGNCFYVKFL